MSKGFKEQVLALRSQGRTYNAICKELGCSKATVAYHCSSLQGQKEIIEKNKNLLRKYSQIPQDKQSLLWWLLENRIRRSDIALALDIEYAEVLRFGKEHQLEKTYAALSTYERVKRRRKHLKMLAVASKGGSCQQCGYHRSVRALAFHHPDPKEKDFTVSQNANRAWKNISEEIAKCVLLCHNCHNEEHERLDEDIAPMPDFIWTALNERTSTKEKGGPVPDNGPF